MLDYPRFLDRVAWAPELDGGGRYLAPVFERALRGECFKRCLEWCAGPAWIGLWLKECGICDELVATDINPDAIEAVTRTGGATAYLSDCMDNVPEGERFDLVVANPPNYCNIQASHYLGNLMGDRRASDPKWSIHEKFYSQIADWLDPGAELWISEVEPHSAEVRIAGMTYDIRDKPPILEFERMMKDGGLDLIGEYPFTFAGLDMALLRARKPE